MVAIVDAVTEEVVIVKVVVELPAGTVTVAGTLALGELELTAMDAPPAPAAPVRVTVQMDVAPPLTVLGDTATLDRVAGVTVSVVD